MRRQKKFYAWGYADEDLSRQEIVPWEAAIARHYGLSGFDVTPPPLAEEIALRAPRVAVPASLQAIVRSDHLTRLEHSYGKAWFDVCRMFMRSVPNPPDAVAFPESEADIVRLLDWCDRIGATVIPYGGGSSVVKGIEPSSAFDKVVTISLRHMDRVLEVDPVEPGGAHRGRRLRPPHRRSVARYALHHAPLHAGLSLLDARRLDRDAIGRPLRHALHAYRRFRRKRAGRDPGRRARNAPPARLRRRPEPGPHVHRLRRHPRHHHRGLGAAPQEADIPRRHQRALQELPSPAPMRCARSPRPGSIRPTSGCSKRARPSPTFRGRTKTHF